GHANPIPPQRTLISTPCPAVSQIASGVSSGDRDASTGETQRSSAESPRILKPTCDESERLKFTSMTYWPSASAANSPTITGVAEVTDSTIFPGSTGSEAAGGGELK